MRHLRGFSREVLLLTLGVMDATSLGFLVAICGSTT